MPIKVIGFVTVLIFYTQESHKSDFLGMAPLLIPFSENNPGIRNIFTSMVCQCFSEICQY